MLYKEHLKIPLLLCLKWQLGPQQCFRVYLVTKLSNINFEDKDLFVRKAAKSAIYCPFIKGCEGRNIYRPLSLLRMPDIFQLAWNVLYSFILFFYLLKSAKSTKTHRGHWPQVITGLIGKRPWGLVGLSRH